MPLEAGAFYVMDRGYLDFKRLYMITQTSAFFVIRAKSNLKCRRVYSHNINKDSFITKRLLHMTKDQKTTQLAFEQIKW